MNPVIGANLTTFVYRFRLLQTTIIGVLLLHLLLIPGVAFFTGTFSAISLHIYPHILTQTQAEPEFGNNKCTGRQRS